MSPLLGAIGDASEYAYRGTLDDVPEDFNFTSIVDAEPGVAYTTGPITITGLNNKVQVVVSAGASIAVNSGIFTSGPTFIRSNDTIAIYTPTTQGTDDDFSKTYTITATVGQTSKDWTVTTRDKDSLPDSFSFTTATNQELDTTVTSNTIILSGLEPTVSSGALITSGIGSFSKNGGVPGTASTVGNGDSLAVVLQSPIDYSKTNTTTLQVGTFSTDFSVVTRDADTTVDQFFFTNFTNVAISSSFDSNSITLSGADTNTVDAPVPLTATVTGGFLKVDRGAIPIRDFSVDPITVFNGDTLTLKINSSPSYSEIRNATLSITGVNTPVGVASTFSVTTRPNISDTVVNNFQFVDKSNQDRGVLVISDPITISGITTGADDFASIFLTNNADGGEFRITRNGVVVRDFGTANSGVRQGDLVDLRIRTSPASEGTVLTNVNIAGTDNNDINNVFSQTRTDTWVVKSAKRNCPLSLPTFQTVTGVNPGTVQSVTFIPAGYDTDCNVKVSTSNSNSTLSVGGTTGNNLVVAPGVACTVFLTAGSFGQSRTTTITLTANNNIPTPISTTSNFTVTTRASSDPTITRFTVTPSTVQCGQQAVIEWATQNTVSISPSGFSGVTTSGFAFVTPTSNTTYSLTATGPDATTQTLSVPVIVTGVTNATLQADFQSIPFNDTATLFWSTQGAAFISNNFGAPSSQLSGSKVVGPLKQTTTYTLTAFSGSSCPNSPQRSVTINVAPCTEEVTTESIVSGVDLTFTVANAGNGFADYLTSFGGFNLSSPARAPISGGTQTFQSGPTLGSYGAGTCSSFQSDSCVAFAQFNSPSQAWQVPAGVTQIQVTVLGAGGGGAGGGSSVRGGRGGDGAQTSITVNVSPGQFVRYDVGAGGQGGPQCESGNIGGGGIGGGPGGTTFARFDNGQFCYATGGGGGRRSNFQTLDGSPGFSDPGGSLNFSSGGLGGTSGNFRGICIGGRGGQGQGGRLFITYTQNIEGASWSSLLSTIVNQFQSSFNRKPTADEAFEYISQYVNSSIDLGTLASRISSSGAFRSSTGLISFCGARL
jgi:hypothetical protein